MSGLRDSILQDPVWLPHTFNPAGDLLDFVRLSLEDRRHLAFLAQEYVGTAFEHHIVPYETVRASAPAEDEAPLHFIFHTSFCCSSLLARALEAGGAAESLREPDILMNLSSRLLREPSPANLNRLDLMLRLLSRPLQARQVIVKPSNFANNLIGPILKLRGGARAVLIHSDLEAFLRSIAKKGMWGRIWARKLFARCSMWSNVRLGLSQAEKFELSDLQAAGLAWLIQATHFRQVAQHHGSPRVTLLHSDTFLAQRESAIRLLSARLDLGHEPEAVRRIAQGEVFARNSKSAERAFDAETREAEHGQALSAYGEEIEMVAKWIAAVADRLELKISLADLDCSLEQPAPATGLP